MHTDCTNPACPTVAPRRGFTLIEVAVAAGMLAILIATSVPMLRVVSSQQRALERRALALQSVQALAEQVSNIPWNQLTATATNQLTVPAPVAPYLPGAKLNVTVDDEPDTPAARRLSIELTWNAPNGQPANPVRLTTWVYSDQLQAIE